MHRLILLLLLALALPAQAEGFITRLLNKPVPGGVAVLDLGMQGPAPRVRYRDKPVLVVKEDGKRWIAIVGIPLTVEPGVQTVTVERNGAPRTQDFQISSRKYREQRITLKNQRQVDPNPEDLKRIERELDEQTAAYRQFSESQPSNLLFDKPVNGPLSSPFGLRRFFNGQERNPHSGLDFAVPAGTVVKAPADGRVMLTGNYFFNGNTIFIDHGQGLVSMFCHLSKIEVKVGDAILRGDALGRVGSTGRATGSHLHWNISLNDVRIDPSIFIGQYKR
ncbi:M23 family metallopeptidase [Azomonas macrocytogenes]|uniref:Murein DD-endopeptidase MepM/ murein hydrolase activator NlpD n=1 Tax=Azomonas macrocytogenes TaxID=69962 RepID=A0A839T991_AZOMA|nr:M23 family metallopeptidase [Azomonas macrocytogenes]MBB3104213.1 murein DD-endopeptidase MepM/ murein hydrolase activator NlpD [Azomonas macrocytogenes]